MKVVIWIGTYIIVSIINYIIGKILGFRAGVLILYPIWFAVAKKLCNLWDVKHKNKSVTNNEGEEDAPINTSQLVPNMPNNNENALADMNSNAESGNSLFIPETEKTDAGIDTAISDSFAIVETANIESDKLTNNDTNLSQIRYCRHCGFKLIEGSEYCSNCGTRIWR